MTVQSEGKSLRLIMTCIYETISNEDLNTQTKLHFLISSSNGGVNAKGFYLLLCSIALRTLVLSFLKIFLTDLANSCFYA